MSEQLSKRIAMPIEDIFRLKVAGVKREDLDGYFAKRGLHLAPGEWRDFHLARWAHQRPHRSLYVLKIAGTGRYWTCFVDGDGVPHLGGDGVGMTDLVTFAGGLKAHRVSVYWPVLQVVRESVFESAQGRIDTIRKRARSGIIDSLDKIRQDLDAGFSMRETVGALSAHVQTFEGCRAQEVILRECRRQMESITGGNES